MARRSFDEMNRMFDELNRMFDHMSADFNRETLLGLNGVSLDLQEHEDGYILVGDLPGFESDEIEILYRDGSIQIDATHEVDIDGPSRRRSVHEQISVPGDILAEDATATYRNGVLEVTLPAADADELSGYRIDVHEN